MSGEKEEKFEKSESPIYLQNAFNKTVFLGGLHRASTVSFCVCVCVREREKGLL